MRIALIFYVTDSFGGAERRLIRIYSEICREANNIECDLLFRNCNIETARNLISSIDCDQRVFHEVMCFKKPISSVRYLLVARKYDIVHFIDACKFNIVYQYVCKIRNMKNLYTIASYGEAYNSFDKQHMNMVKQQLKLADAVDLLYPSGKSFIKSLAKDKLLRITPGTFTDLTVFRPTEKQNTMVFAARLEEAKNPMLLIEACVQCKMRLRQYGYKIIILGKGDYERKMKTRIAEESMSDIIDLVGYAQPGCYLPQAKVFFSLQREENYPSQSLAEASASGCFCIITDVGDSRNSADDTFATFVEADPADLAEKMCYYMEKQEEDKRMIVDNARRFAEDHYTIDTSKEYFVDLFKEIIKL